MMALSRDERQRIVQEFAVRHNGLFDASLFLDEVRRGGKKHPAHSWFEWDASKAAQAYQLEQARAFARDLRVSFTVEELGRSEPIRIRSEMPMLLSPVSGRAAGGGYVLVDPNDPAHLAEHCRQAADGLKAWWRRYEAAALHAGVQKGAVDGMVLALVTAMKAGERKKVA